jgi:hypothetical protein
MIPPAIVHLDRRDHPRAQAYYDDLGQPVRLEHAEGVRWGIDDWKSPGERYDRYRELER